MSKVFASEVADGVALFDVDLGELVEVLAALPIRMKHAVRRTD